MRRNSLADFSPVSLNTVSIEVKKKHSGEHWIDLVPGDQELKDLAALLTITPESQLGELLPALATRQIAILPDIALLPAADVLERKVIGLSGLLNNPKIALRAARLLVSTGEQKILPALVRDALESGHAGALGVPPEHLERCVNLLVGSDLPARLLADLESSGMKYDRWCSDIDVAFPGWGVSAALTRLVRVQLLQSGSATTLALHESELLDWVIQLSEGNTHLLESFAANYIGTLESGHRWRKEVLDWLFDKLGQPSRKRLTGAWRRIDDIRPGVVAAILRWLALLKMEDFFREANDPHGRFEFWREHFSEHIIRATPVARGEAILLHMPPLAIVEFSEKGNAAYVYPESEHSRLVSRRNEPLAHYKDRDRLLRRSRNEEGYRILHNAGWQSANVGVLRRMVGSMR